MTNLSLINPLGGTHMALANRGNRRGKRRSARTATRSALNRGAATLNMFPESRGPKFDPEIDEMIGPKALATDFLVVTTSLLESAKRRQE